MTKYQREIYEMSQKIINIIQPNSVIVDNFLKENLSPEVRKDIELALSSTQRVPTEQELVEKLQVSRSKVRETLKILECMDVIRARRGSGHVWHSNSLKNYKKFCEFLNAED